MFQVFIKLAALAHPVIKHYAADFYLHDAKVLAEMRPGDVALWAPRESGSCLIVVARNRIGNERAMETLRAFQSIGQFDWQLIDTNIDGDWTVEPAANPESIVRQYDTAREHYNRARIREGLDPVIVKELHM